MCGRLDALAAPVLAHAAARSAGTRIGRLRSRHRAEECHHRGCRPRTLGPRPRCSTTAPRPAPTPRAPPAWPPSQSRRAEGHVVNGTADRSGVCHKELPTDRPRRRQGLRRLPERRHRQGHPPRRARGHALHRARQALHHQRHGHRPGQDVQHQRPEHRWPTRWASAIPEVGAHHLPPALHARPPSAPSPATTRTAISRSPAKRRSTAGRTRTAPSLNPSRSGAAPGIFRNPARTCAPP